ncbi:hypothetical protein BJ508DRAFT_333368 [Ascobolus immersus RN42]|uniref:Uncharacterized protein n=1 Tax=Ascobolus immersus RN42 TaxID=1160509 RepID=A0A3N4HMI3_ASCIM|nr:hypothetical protein BJ508DRAFT_333368 [Ascobolus immersus RN42]
MPPSSPSPDKHSKPSLLQQPRSRRVVVLIAMTDQTTDGLGHVLHLETDPYPDLVLLLEVVQLVQYGQMSTDAPGLLRLCGHDLPLSGTVLMGLQTAEHHQSRPTLQEVKETVASFFHSCQTIESQVPPPQLPIPKCETLRNLTLEFGSTAVNREAGSTTTRRPELDISRRRGNRGNQGRRTRRMRKACKSRDMLSGTISGEILPQTVEHVLIPQNLPPLLSNPVSPFLPTNQTLMSNSDDDDALYPRPPQQLINEALKLETCSNSKAPVLLQKISRVRIRIGLTRWNETKAEFPEGVTYEAADFNILRRMFLEQYETWQLSVAPLPEAPAELLGIRRRRATTTPAQPAVDVQVPPPLPPVNGNQQMIDGQAASSPLSISDTLARPPVTPIRPVITQLPLSAWLSTQGARLARLLPNMPFTPRTPTPTPEQTRPGDYPSPELRAIAAEQERAFFNTTYLEEDAFIADSESLQADADCDETALVIYPSFLDSSPPPPAGRPESLYSDDIDDVQLFPDIQLVPPHLYWPDQDRVEENERPEMSYYPHQPLFTARHPARSVFGQEPRKELFPSSSPEVLSEAEVPKEPSDVSNLLFPEEDDDTWLLPPTVVPPQNHVNPPFPLHHSPLQTSPTVCGHSPNELYDHLPSVPSEILSSVVATATSLAPMATLSAEQFASLLTSVEGLFNARAPEKKVSFKDANVAIFHPNLPVDATHPAGRSCVVNGKTYYRSPRLMVAEIRSQKTVMNPAELARSLPSKLEGPARTWWRDILSQTERDAIIKDETCATWESKLLEQFDRDQEDPLAQLYENKFTVARLKNGDDLFSWALEQAAQITEAGITSAHRVKTLYSCLDPVLKNEFGPPGTATMTEYISSIQSKASVFRQKLLQQDAEHKVRESRTVSDILGVLRSVQQQRPVAMQQAPAPPPYSQPPRPYTAPTPSSFQPPPPPPSLNISVQPFSGRPCRHCNGAHMDNTCPQRPGSRPCRFCGGAHFDHVCAQKPAGFKNCSICQGPHYTSVCPSATKDSTSPPFANMQVGQPSSSNTTPATGTSSATGNGVQSAAFVNTTTSATTIKPKEDNVCGSCQGAFPSRQALFTHAILSGHQIDAEVVEVHACDYTPAYSDYDSVSTFGYGSADAYDDPAAAQPLLYNDLHAAISEFYWDGF